MELGSIASSRAAVLPQAAPVLESEAAERVPDNEAGESAKTGAIAQAGPDKAPLPYMAGTLIDTQA